MTGRNARRLDRPKEHGTYLVPTAYIARRLLETARANPGRLSEATVSKITLVTRKDYGGSYLAMCSQDLGADMVIAWPTAERFTYTSVGGLEIEAWLQFPYGYEAGRKYPLVLYIHGGPHSAYGEGWFDEFHNTAGAGMFVLYTNPRGSSG